MYMQVDLNRDFSDYIIPGHYGFYTVKCIPADKFETPFRIATNLASDHDLRVFEHGLKYDKSFREFVEEQRKQWERLGVEAMKEEARLKNACSRVLEGQGGFLPPNGPLLLQTDKPPHRAAVHYDPEGVQIEEVRLRRSETHQEEFYYRKRFWRGPWHHSSSPKDDAAEKAAHWRMGILTSTASRGQAGPGQPGPGQPPGGGLPGLGQPSPGQPSPGQPSHGLPGRGLPGPGLSSPPGLHGPRQPGHGQPAHGQPSRGQPARRHSGHKGTTRAA